MIYLVFPLGHLLHFSFLVIINKTVTKSCDKESLPIQVIISLGDIYRNQIAESRWVYVFKGFGIGWGCLYEGMGDLFPFLYKLSPRSEMLPQSLCLSLPLVTHLYKIRGGNNEKTTMLILLNNFYMLPHLICTISLRYKLGTQWTPESF